ncbi:hypothetical protein Tco_0881387 [Tanacetum coccineum]
MKCTVTRFMVVILRGFGVNPLRIKVGNVLVLEIDGVWSRHGVRTLRFRGYGGGGDLVVRHGLKGCLDHWIQRSSPLLPPLPLDRRDCLLDTVYSFLLVMDVL